jgi:hypothetical protein
MQHHWTKVDGEDNRLADLLQLMTMKPQQTILVTLLFNMVI